MRKRKLFGSPFGFWWCYRMPRSLLAFLVAGALGAAPAAARAESDVHELTMRPAVDWTVTGLLGVGWIGTEVWKEPLAPETCRRCSDTVPGLDRQVRDAWKWENTQAADDASDVLDFVVLPVAVLGADALLASRHGALRGWDEDALVIVEAAMIAAAVNQVVKFSVGRERPFVHALDPDEKTKTEHPDDNNLSFYSGHTSLAFALAGAGGSVATMRGYRHGWVVWPVAGAMAAGVGYLRIGADKHWFTDVATGAVVGGAIGVGVPYLLHAPKKGGGDASALSGAGRASVMIAPGPQFAIAFVF